MLFSLLLPGTEILWVPLGMFFLTEIHVKKAFFIVVLYNEAYFHDILLSVYMIFNVNLKVFRCI